MTRRERLAVGGLAVAGVLVLLAFGLTAPLAQDPAYFDFADTRTWRGIPNFWNVASNAGFLAAGSWGLVRLRHIAVARRALVPAFLAFFVGVVATSFGSAWFHLHPGNATLVWDRLPMTVAFAGLVGLVAGDYVSPRSARPATVGWLVLGFAAVLYWYAGETRGAGDLRAYAVAQFLPLAAIVPLLVVARPVSPLRPWIALLAVAYIAAKLAEGFDAEIFVLTGFGGHALKHLLAAAGTAAIAAGVPVTRQLRA